MIVITSIGLISVIIALVSANSKYKYGLELAFGVLTIMMALRYGVGPDYFDYLAAFDRFNEYSKYDYTTNEHMEIGWRFLCRICQPIGFFGMTIIITIFENVVLYRLIKKYVSPKLHWLAIAIFVLYPNNMLIGMSMMRQFLSMTIVLLAFEFILKRKIVIPAALILLAGLFHTSAYITIPFLLFALKKDSPITTKSGLILIISYLVMFVFAQEIFSFVFSNALSYEGFSKWENSSSNTREAKYGISTIIYWIIYLCMIYYHRNFKRDEQFVILLFLFSPFFTMFSSVAFLASRLGMYFSILSIVCIPLFVESKNLDVRFKYFIILAYLAILLNSYIDFYSTPAWQAFYTTYYTVFEAPSWQ